MRGISARWIFHLRTKEQKLARVRIAKQLFKQFPKYNNRSFANIITGDETWVHFYEPKRKIQNKTWATKGGKRPCIAKRTMSIKNVAYVIFFTNQVPAIQGWSGGAMVLGKLPVPGGPTFWIIVGQGLLRLQ